MQSLLYISKRLMMAKEKKQLNAKMREIIRVLHKKGGSMSEHEIAKETGFSYITVRKWLRDLVKKGLILEVKKK